LVSAFLADLWARLTPSGAGSALSSETLPALFFRRLSWFRAALFRFRGVTTAPRAHAHELHIAKAMCTSAQAVGTLRHAMATATRPRAQAHDNTSRCTAVTTTTTTVMTTTNVDNEASCASARHFCIASRNGDSNYSDNKRQELDNKALCASAQRHIASHNGDDDISYASAQYHHIILRRVKAMTTTTISDDE
jgi:hypothetical protein